MFALEGGLPVEVIELSSVVLLGGITPPTLRIVGKDFRSVGRVAINNIESPNVLISSRTVLDAEVPLGVNPLGINSIQVMSTRLTLSPQNLLQFRLLDVPTATNGIFRLVQLFIKVLFTTPGRDIFNQSLGGGALRNLGRTYDRADSASIISDLHISSQQAARQLMAIQARSPRTPLNERLQSATVLSSEYVRDQQALYASIELLSQTNEATVLNLAT